jgi:two-component system, chemotaxis family, protein-glutamate methylesterase/glutaminase
MITEVTFTSCHGVRFRGSMAPMSTTHDIVVVGTSAGGVEALKILVGGLPKSLAAAVLIVMHTSPEGPYFLPDILGRAGSLQVSKPREGDLIERGNIYIAPPGHHLLVKGERINLSKGPKENRSRPAIDPLFRTAAIAYGPRVVGVILTGMLDDGTAGLSAVKERGGIAVVQNPEDALYSSMPQSAIRHVRCDYVLPVSEIASLLTRLASEPAGASENKPVTRLMEVESRFVEMETMSMKDMDAIGTHAGVSCPECHGPIWKLEDGTLQRYRCHVGHAYTAQSMVAGQIEAQEIHLWQALRLMKERVSLIEEMRSHAPQESDTGYYAAEVKQLQNNILQIQEMLERAIPGTGEA